MVNTNELSLSRLDKNDFGKYRCSAAVGEHYETLVLEVHVLQKGQFLIIH